MERIQTFRAGLQRIVESPRAPVLWSVMLCIFTLTFLAQVISASYVFTTVRLGMEGQKTQQEKKINEEVLTIYDPTEYAHVRTLIDARTKTFAEELEKRAPIIKESVVPEGVQEGGTVPSASKTLEQKKR